MVLHGYITCWNEVEILPFVLDYWKKIGVSKLFVYDNGSTDGTLEMLAEKKANGYDFIEIRHFDSNGKTDEFKLTEIRNTAWKESKEIADFVIVCDCDEVPFCTFNFQAVMVDFFKRYVITAKTKMHQLICEDFPKYEEGKLMHETEGMRFYDEDTYMDKHLLFNLKLVEEINFSLGSHTCSPKIKSGYERRAQIADLTACDAFGFFHLKYLGKEYMQRKSERLYNNLREDIKAGERISCHYKWWAENVDEMFDKYWRDSHDSGK